MESGGAPTAVDPVASAPTAVVSEEESDALGPTTPGRPGARTVVATSRRRGDDLEPGTAVEHYELIRELGRGGMGRVFLARDIKLGRRVAIKFIDGSSPRFVERFVVEARATARCSHENIVVIHEVDEFRGRPYMVLEYLDGKPLSRVLSETGPMPGSRAVEIIVPVVRALVRAHGLGIVHRDLKPENVFVTHGGQVKVLDFGIAKLFDEPTPSADRPPVLAAADSLTRTHGVVGTPPFMAPEQLAGGAIDVRADVWAVGIMLFEMVVGEHPLAPVTTASLLESAAELDVPLPTAGSRVAGLSPALDRVIAGCLAKRVEHRTPTAEALLAQLEPLLPLRSDRRGEEDQPFPGLRAFAEADAHRFFGRDADVVRVVAQVREQPLVVLVGASGVGKSSTLRAGVVPALRAAGDVAEVFELRPGREPLAALAGLVEVTTAPPGAPPPDQRRDDLAERLRGEPGYLGAVLCARARTAGGRVLLLIDQLEELHTLGASDDDRRTFARVVGGLADDPSAPIRVIASLRVDLLDRVADDRLFGDALARGLVFLHAPDRDGLREALVGPLAQVGYSFDPPELVDDMLDEVDGTPDALPLLQFVAARLWERRDRARRTVTRAAYDETGGVAGALARHAEQVVAALPAGARTALRPLLLRLVTADGTRAVVDRDELAGVVADPGDLDTLIDVLTAARLIVVQAAGERATVELVHESLISRWPTLVRLRDQGHEDALFIAQLRAAAAQWHARGRDPGLVWRGEVAADACRLADRHDGALPAREAEYLDAVRALAARTARRRRIAVGAVMLVLATVAVVALVALLSIRRAEQHARGEADRARAAEVRARADLERATRAEAARIAAEASAGDANSRAALSRAQLVEANARLEAALAEARQARDDAEAARARAETAARQARDDAKAIEALAEQARRARAEAERLLTAERARVKLLEQERKQINTGFK